jgi:hypothetical protein
MSVDIVRELISRLLDAAAREGTLTESLALEVERAFRNEFAGDTFYIKKLPIEMSGKPGVVKEQYLRSVELDKIADKNGISRATLYRYLKR